MTIEEKQKLLLNHKIKNLETVKSYRLQIPIAICILLIGICFFILNSKIMPHTKHLQILIIAIQIVIMLAGLVVLWVAHREYKRIVLEIFHLYQQLKINIADYYDPKKKEPPKKQEADIFYWIGYGVIVLIAFITILAIIEKGIIPIKKSVISW